MNKSNARVDNVNKTEGGGGVLQTEATNKAQIISIEEYLNTKYSADQFVNIVRIHVSYLPIMNSTIQR
jgi:hypothetical protein